MPDHPPATPRELARPDEDLEPTHVPEYVIAAGAYRSGSTWLYNAARLAIALAGHSVYGRFYDGTYDPENPAKWHVVKVHRFEDEVLEVARLVLTSIRDPRDIAASAVRRGLIEGTPDAVEAFVQEAVFDGYERWRPHAALTMRYEDLRGGASRPILSRLLEVLAPCEVSGVTVEQLERALETLRPGTHYDRETLLWPNHLTDGRVHGYARTLSAAAVERIESRFGDWMTANGYSV